LAWSADGETVAVGGTTVQFFMATTGQPCGRLVLLDGEKGLALDADGNYRASNEDGGRLIWLGETAGGQKLLSLEEFAKQHGWRNQPDKLSLAGK
jgi:hypothetical protein